MLHQTLIPSSSSHPLSSPPASSPTFTLSNAAAAAAAAPLRSSSSSSAAMPSYAHHHSSLDEGMDALKGSSRQEDTPDVAAAAAEAPAAWGFADKDGFSVEDLLDLEEFCEADKDAADEEAPAAVKQDKPNNDGSQQSVVSYELVPPAPPAPEIVDLPAHDVEELEWVSRIMDDSLSELSPQPAPPASVMASLAARPPQHHRLLLPQRRPHPHDGAYRALPSMSEPMRTPTICALSTEALVPVKAKRSKRSRASGWSLSGPTPDATSSSSTTTTSCSSSASFSPSFLLDSPQLGASDLMEEYNILPSAAKKSKHGKSSKHKAKKRGRKPKQHLPPHPSSAMAAAAQSDHRCSHCGVQKTPQWRAGPEGAKTLCNACGVRYKSGRLLPEYRPACSPTYVSNIHSNSHRKVLEMRRKKEDGPLTVATAPAVASF